MNLDVPVCFNGADVVMAPLFSYWGLNGWAIYVETSRMGSFPSARTCYLNHSDVKALIQCNNSITDVSNL